MEGQGNINVLTPPTCENGTSYYEGTEVSVQAIPFEGFEFESWTGDINSTDETASLTMTGDKAISALFSSVIVSPGTEDQTIDLQSGWVMVSLSVNPYSSDIDQVLNSISGRYDLVYSFDNCNGGWKSYSPSQPSFVNTLSTLDAGQGYWIRMTEAATLTISGTPVSDTSIDMCTGWNLVGYPETPTEVETALSSIDGQYSSILSYIDGQWRSFSPDLPPFANSLTTLQSGQAYWIQTTQDTTLTID